jgi:DNA-binding transcriptional regulator YdaS (Cro superfamily)
MELKTYLKNLTDSQRQKFADRCETSVGHLRNVAYDCKSCAEKLAIAIERETDGAVRCEDLRPDVDWQYLRGTAA